MAEFFLLTLSGPFALLGLGIFALWATRWI